MILSFISLGMTHPQTLRLWASIAAVVITAVTGDVLTAHAMRNIGDLDRIRVQRGLSGTIRAVLSEPRFAFGVCAMSLSFFSLLYALAPPAPVSLIAPASGSLTYIGNAVIAKYFLKENVGRRRWLAACLVCIGVYLLHL